MKDDVATCPKCGTWIIPDLDDLEGESFGEDEISQSWVFTCPECGTRFRVTDHFTLTDTTYELV